MERTPVKSSMIKSVGHEVDSEGSVLEVEFTNGKIYSYADVPVELYEEMLKTESVGIFFNLKIKNNFVHLTNLPDMSADVVEKSKRPLRPFKR